MVVVYRSDRAFILNRQTSEVSLKNAKVGMEFGRNNYQDFGCRRGKKKRTAKTVLQVFFNLSQQENFGNFQSTTTSGINNN